MWIWTTDKQIQLVVRARLEFKKFRWQGQYFDLSAIRVVIDFFFLSLLYLTTWEESRHVPTDESYVNSYQPWLA